MLRVLILSSLLTLLFVAGLESKAHSQTARWTILRPEYADGGSYAYFSISACDDHNFTAPAFREDSIGVHLLLVRTTDAGSTWAVQDPGLSIRRSVNEENLRTAIQIDSLHVIAIGDSGLVVRTSDGGATWIRQDYSQKVLMKCIHFSDPLHGIMCGARYGNILTTSDGGESWQLLPNPSVFGIVSCHSYGNGRYRLFKYGYGPIYTTNDNGETWDSVNVFDPTDPADSLGFCSACEFMGTDSLLAYGSIESPSFIIRHSWVRLSTDGGKSWKDLLNRITYINAGPYSISVANNSLWLAGGYGDGTFYSTDHGATWEDDTAILVGMSEPYQFQQMNTVQVVSPTRAIGVMGNDLAGNIVSLDISKLSVQQYEREVFGTHVYPNPASGFVNIQSTVGSAPIILVDPLGKEPIVAQLNPDGTLRIDISKLRNGVYQVNMFYNGAILHITNLVVLPQ